MRNRIKVTAVDIEIDRDSLMDQISDYILIDEAESRGLIPDPLEINDFDTEDIIDELCERELAVMVLTIPELESLYNLLDEAGHYATGTYQPVAYKVKEELFAETNRRY